MTDLTPEKRAEWRMVTSGPSHGVNINSRVLRALLDAADERDWLQTVVGRLGRVNGEYAMEIHRCREALGVDEDTDPHHAAQALAAAVGRVRALHVASWGCGNPLHTNLATTCPDCSVDCDACGEMYPCPTIRALDGTDGGPTP